LSHAGGFRKRLGEWGLVSLGLVAACLLIHGPMIVSGLARTQADLLDTRFNNYLLEHSFRRLCGDVAHASFWNPPFCYPAANLLAYSDVMVSFAPPYWLARLIGLAPDTAFQVWMLVATAINFLLGYVVVRKAIGATVAGAWCGALLFAAAGSRAAQLGHSQLYCQVFVLLTLYGLLKLFRAPDADGYSRRGRWIVLVITAIVLQMWGGFYTGFFLVLAIGIGLAWAVCLTRCRRCLVGVLCDNWRAAIVSLLLAAVCLAPLARHYLAVVHATLPPDDAAVAAMLPQVNSWFYMGTTSVIYHGLDPIFANIATPEEHAIGLGLLTMLVAIVGLRMRRGEPIVWIITAVAGTIILLATQSGDGRSLWWLVRRIVPGAVAIRAVARIGLLMIIPASVGLCWVVDRIWRANRPVLGRLALVGVIVTFCLAEQLQRLPTFSKADIRHRVDQIAASIPPHAQAFFYTGNQPGRWPLDQVDAMWASMQTGIPTINGYSGNWPAGLRTLIVESSALSDGHSGQRAALDEWMRQNSVDPQRVCWVKGR
jgi:hypothetical protein